jgi:hypothetical protein
MRFLLALGAAGALASSCSSGIPAPSPSPSRSPPANAVVNGLVTGHAHVEVSGDIEHVYDWELLGASDDPAVTIISWGHGLDSFDLLAMPAAIVKGKHPTSLDLWLDLRLDSLHHRFLSEQGECSITLTQVDLGLLAGRVRCAALSSEKGTAGIELTVRFSAGSRG